MVSAAAIPIAFLLDVAVGEPPRRFHPVAWFGSSVAPTVDREWAHPRVAGLVVAAVAPFAAATLLGALVGAVALVSVPAGVVAAALVLFVTTSRRRLLERARSVVTASDDDPERARADLPALVGRETGDLSLDQIRSAAVESAAENLADGLVAPLLAFALGGAVGGFTGPQTALALAAGAATWLKAVNTLDSMVGYPHRPVGWASARLDDVAMWVPARVTALLIAAVAGQPRALATARNWLSSVPSPNAGWPMGTLAAVAGCRLEKPGTYVLNSDASLPSAETSLAGIRTVDRAALAAYGLATLVAALEVVAWS